MRLCKSNRLYAVGLLISAAAVAHGASLATDTAVGPPCLSGLDAAQLQQMLNMRKISSVELVRISLARISAYDGPHGNEPGLRAIVQIDARALQDARQLDDERAKGHLRGPFHGIPVLLKEIFNVKGLPTPGGFGEVMKHIVAPDDAFIVRKLREAGMIILGHTDAGSTNAGNPFNRTLSPGGSSSGNGAALAAGYAPVAIGEDTFGSTRIPAAWTSTVGFRPTTGWVSMDGATPFSLTYDTPGPQARTVEDVARMMDVIAGFDPDDPASVKKDLPSTFTRYLNKAALKGRKIGIYSPAMIASDDAVRGVIQSAAGEMKQLGAEVVTLDETVISIDRSPPGTELLWEIAGDRGLNWAAGFDEGIEWVAARDRWLSTLHADDSELARIAPPENKLTIADIAAAEGMTDPLPAPATPADYQRNARLRAQLRVWFGTIVSTRGVDAVIYPTVRKIPQPKAWGFMWQNTSLASLLGFPAISVPAGFVDGLPVGLDIMGTAAGQDAEILGMGYAYEQGTHHRRSPASTPPLLDERELPKNVAFCVNR